MYVIAPPTGNICVYCPGGPDSDFEYSTQSYTGYEPTSMRAIRARYNPYVQARSRVDQLRRLGHSVDKVGPPPSLCTCLCMKIPELPWNPLPWTPHQRAKVQRQWKSFGVVLHNLGFGAKQSFGLQPTPSPQQCYDYDEIAYGPARIGLL